MPQVVSQIIIRSSKEKIYTVIKNMKDYPKFMPDLISVEILEQGKDTDITHWISNVEGRRITWTERDNFYPDIFKISYVQTEGDLKKMEGAWELADVPEGVQVSLTVDFEFGIPMIAGMLNPLLKRKVRENCVNMLAAVKKQIESQPFF